MATNLAIGITRALVVLTAPRPLQVMAPHHGWSICWCRWCLAWRTPGGHGRHLHRAGQRERALRATWIGAGIVFAMTEAMAWAAAYPAASAVRYSIRSLP